MRIFSSISTRSCEETEERNWRIAVETIAFGVASESLSTRFNFAEGFPARIHGKLGLSTDDEREKSRSLFLRRGTKVAEVPWRLYHTYFYTEYFNNNNINICTGWSCPDRSRSKHDAHTRISLHFSCSFSTIDSSADTGTTFIQRSYRAARVAWNNFVL